MCVCVYVYIYVYRVNPRLRISYNQMDDFPSTNSLRYLGRSNFTLEIYFALQGHLQSGEREVQI